MMAATRRRSRRAPTRKASAKRGSSRAAPRQPRAPRAPLLAPGQGKDLAGLALLVFGAFTAFTLWSAGHGAFASDGLRAALRVSVGEGSTLVPLLALAAGLALLLKVEATRVRPFRTGAMLLTAGLLLALSGSSLVRISAIAATTRSRSCGRREASVAPMCLADRLSRRRNSERPDVVRRATWRRASVEDRSRATRPSSSSRASMRLR